MTTKKLSELYFFYPKSKVPAGDGLRNGEFPFYTSSPNLQKWLNESHFNIRALIFGTGGNPSIHFAEGRFGVSTDCLVASSQQQEVNIKYTYYYLLHNIHLLEEGFKGIGLRHISKSYIENLKISYPDLETQNKIVAILDKTRSLIEKNEEVIAMYELLLMSIFDEKFSPFEAQDVRPLEEVAKVISGLTKGKKNDGKKTRFVPYMRVANVQDGFLDLQETKEICATEEEIQKYLLEPNDLLLTEGGDADKLGRGALWVGQVNECIFQNHIFRVRIKNLNELNPVFLAYQTAGQYGKNYFLKAAKQTSGIASISTVQMRNFPVYVPPFSIQKEFEKIVTLVTRLKEIASYSADELHQLQNSLSQSAFSGTLIFSAAVELETILNRINVNGIAEKNDISGVVSNSAILQLLLQKLNNRQLDYEEQYEKAKYVVFRILKEENELVKQIFDEKEQQIKLNL